MVQITNKILVFCSTLIILLFPVIFSCTKKEKAPDPRSADIDQERIALSVNQSAEQNPKKIIVANVNGTEISMAALIREMNRISASYIRRDVTISPEMDKKIKNEAMNTLIFRELAIGEAVRQGLSADHDKINEIIKQIKSSMHSPGAYKDYLATRGLSEGELRQEIERSHLFEMITGKEVYAAVVVDEKMLKEKYDQEKSLFVSPGNPGATRKFSEVRNFLERMVKAEQGAERMKQWEKKLRDKAVIQTVLASSSK